MLPKAGELCSGDQPKINPKTSGLGPIIKQGPLGLSARLFDFPCTMTRSILSTDDRHAWLVGKEHGKC